MVRRLTALVLVGLFGLVLARLALDYVPDSALNRSAQYYASQTVAETGAQNVVAAIIVTYRGLDTLGEVTVLFLTSAIVALVLAGSRAPARARGSGLRPQGELLSTGAGMLAPIIVLFAVYITANGHLTPGGGFQGGAVLASAALLMLLAEPGRRFSTRLIARLESASGLGFVLLALAGLALGAGFLDPRILPLGRFGTLISGGAIPLIYALIGLKVGAEFAAILESLEESED